MKYTSEDALSEIMRRGKQVVIRRKRHTCQVLTCVSVAVFLALVSVIVHLPASTSLAPSDSVYGAFLLSKEAGGYVLAALLAFMLGVAVTILSLHYKKWKNSQDELHQSLKRKNEK